MAKSTKEENALCKQYEQDEQGCSAKPECRFVDLRRHRSGRELGAQGKGTTVEAGGSWHPHDSGGRRHQPCAQQWGEVAHRGGAHRGGTQAQVA